MTTATTTLADFLLARIAEDEAAAQAAISGGSPEWRVAFTHGARVEVANHEGEWDVFAHTIVFDEGSPSSEQAAHIARHDPARVLAECAAKRAIITRLDELLADETNLDDHGMNGEIIGLRYAVSVQASVYADHPDYREEWRP